jgi:UDP-glucose 4-epimerase
MKILITGIAGFIGSSVAIKLKKNNVKIFGIDNLFSGIKKNIPKNIKWKKIDIRNIDSFKKLPKKFDIIIHAAAQTSGEKSFSIPSYDFETNALGTCNVYHFAKMCNAKLMINLSSMSVYGAAKRTKIVNENFNLKPISVYGNSKLTAEKMLEILFERHRIPVVNLRLFNVYGPGQNLNNLQQGMVSIYLYYLLYKKKIVVKGSLSRIRDFIFIDDVTNAINSIINSKLYTNGTFNISSKKKTTVRNLIKLLQKNFKTKKDIIVNKKTQGDIFGFSGNNDKFRKKYKWRPTFTLKKGIKILSEYYGI